MGLADLLAPATESADYGDAPRYWSYQDISVEVYRVAYQFEGILRVRGYPMARVGPDTHQKVERKLEKTLLTLRPELREKLRAPHSKSALERIVEDQT